MPKNFSTITINLLIIIICLALHIKFSTPLLAQDGDPQDADVSSSERGDGGVNSPLDQFLIKDLMNIFIDFGLNAKLSFTNMSLYLIAITSIAYILNVIYNKLKGLASNL